VYYLIFHVNNSVVQRQNIFRLIKRALSDERGREREPRWTMVPPRASALTYVTGSEEYWGGVGFRQGATKGWGR